MQIFERFFQFLFFFAELSYSNRGKPLKNCKKTCVCRFFVVPLCRFLKKIILNINNHANNQTETWFGHPV